MQEKRRNPNVVPEVVTTSTRDSRRWGMLRSMYVKRRSMESIREDTNEVHQHLLAEARTAEQANVVPLSEVTRTRDSSPSRSSSDGGHLDVKVSCRYASRM